MKIDAARKKQQVPPLRFASVGMTHKSCIEERKSEKATSEKRPSYFESVPRAARKMASKFSRPADWTARSTALSAKTR